MNSLWRIAHGDYDLIIDRRSLTYSLTETKTNTVWAESLSVGWIELEDRETGARTRYDFGQAKVVSISEKSSYQGKRILFGLDIDGIPVDLYFICSQREIQLTVEATRDSKTHLVQDVGLFPGLVSVPEDGASYLVIPAGEGAMCFARDVPGTPETLPVWDAENGVTMPFIGAVRCDESDVRKTRTALALITDSAYGRFTISRGRDGNASLDLDYTRDPERRRLDIRIVPLAEAAKTNHVAIARAYRDKIIAERNHVPLRRKIRERSEVEQLIGATFQIDREDTSQDRLVSLGIDRYVFALVHTFDPGDLPILETDILAQSESRWDAIEETMQRLAQLSSHGLIGASTQSDWASIGVDFWWPVKSRSFSSTLPLLSVVYRDSVVSPKARHSMFGTPFPEILNLSLPIWGIWEPRQEWDRPISYTSRDAFVRRTYAILSPLHRLTFAAFLTEHRFLTADRKVEEAVYSDKTRVVINQSETDDWQSDDLHLPPLGFYVRHAQMEAHYARRVGETEFATRAWRIQRSQDEQPLELSGNVLEQEFAID